MAYVKTRGLVVPVNNMFTTSGTPTAVATTLDAAADRWSAVFRAPKAGVIDKIRVSLGAVAKDATTKLMASFKTVSLTDGNPSGTETYFREVPNADIVANDFLLTGKITDDGSDTGAQWTVAMGDLLAASIRISTFVAADSIAINSITTGARAFGTYTNYLVENLTGTYAKTNVKAVMMTLFYSDGSVEEIVDFYPAMEFGSVTYANTSTPDEYGLRFSLPYPAKISGVWVGIDLDGDADLVLYTASGLTNLGSWDKDVRTSALNQAASYQFNAEQTIAANTAYLLAVRPTSASSVGLSYADVAAQVDWDAWGGQELYGGDDKDPAVYGDFNLTTTRRYMMGLKISALDDGAGGGGGGLLRANMSGGVL